MERCFVIQPFDNDKYDKRFNDIFKPAIERAGLEAYRIDKDLSVRIQIDEIEKNIFESPICFAEITTDNPNVWYELGYAFACKKDVVMVCSDERKGYFPFDIQHRNIIKYKTSSKSDFESLEGTITSKIKAYRSNRKTVKEATNSTQIAYIDKLKSHEIAMLVLIIENQLSSEDYVSIYQLRVEMNKAGYTDIATSVGIRSLKIYKLIETFEVKDTLENQVILMCRLTDIGEQWIFNNQDKLGFKIKQTEIDNNENLDDLPF